MAIEIESGFSPKISAGKPDLEKTRGNSQGFESFLDSVMKPKTQDTQAMASRPPKAEKTIAKPKVGNREPFFPQVAMPQHAEPKPLAMKAESDEGGAAVGASSIGDSDSSVGGVNSTGRASLESRVSARGEKAESLKDAEVPDDQNGLMNASYQAATVAYPVKQVAAEAVGEEVRASLESQGMWNAPSTVVAIPTGRMMPMIAATQTDVLAGQQTQRPISQFMASLENELGVSPDRLVQAFAQLPDGAFEQSPEATMAQVVKNLDLPPAQEKQALKLYGEMIQALRGQDQSRPDVQLAQAAPAAVIAQQALGDSKANERMNRRTGSVDGKATAQASLAAASAGARGEVLQGSQKVNSEGAIQQNAEMNTAQGSFEEAATFSKQQGSTQDFERESFAKAAKSSVKSEKPMQMDLGSAGATSGNSAHAVSHVKTASDFSPAAVGAGGTASNFEALSSKEHVENMQSLVNNARMLAQKGGGEMTMTLKPDHVGEIQLKVNLDGNRVDVQMVTERQDVKRMLEQGTNDLKSALATHGLSMERMSVNVSDRAGSGLNQDRPDTGQSRDFAAHQQQQQHQNSANHQQSRRGEPFDLNEFTQGVPRKAVQVSSPSRSFGRQTPREGGRLSVVA